MESYGNNNEGFERYSETTVDLGTPVLVSTIVVCVALNTLMPLLVYCGRRRAERRGKNQSDNNNSTSEERSRAEEDDGVVEPDNDDDGSRLTIHSMVSDFVNKVSQAAVDSHCIGQTGNRRLKAALQSRERQLEEEEAEAISMLSVGRLPALGNDCTGSIAGVSTTWRAELDDRRVSLGSTVGQLRIIQQSSCDGSKRDLPWFDMLLYVADWNDEMKHICKLGIPFVAQAAFQGMCETVRVAVIGKRLGTEALSAYVMVMLLVGFSQSLVNGFSESLATVCSQALGAKNYKLAGEYVQLSMIMFVLCFIPMIFFWMAFIEDAIVWFGFEAPVPELGRNFAFIVLFNFLVEGLFRSIHGLMDTIDLEVQSTIFTAVSELISLIGVVLIAMRGNANLEDIGYLYLASTSISLLVNVGIIMWKGWFDEYLDGLIGTFSLKNIAALKVMLKTAIPLSLGELLAYGEWELLTLFASFLGPAEVVAWGLLGTVWETLEIITIAIADAAEVRCAFLLGSNQPERAKMSAYKSVYLCIFVAFLLSSVIFIIGDDLATWMTNDPTLQRMISELIPLFGIGNISLTVGSVAWTLVGAQGRYRLATLVGVSGSWVLTIPLAAILSIALHVDLQGQTAAVVMGYALSGVLNSYFLFCSDWKDLAQKAFDENAEDSSSSSSESDSDSDGHSESSDESPVNHSLAGVDQSLQKAELSSDLSQHTVPQATLTKSESISV